MSGLEDFLLGFAGGAAEEGLRQEQERISLLRQHSLTQLRSQSGKPDDKQLTAALNIRDGAAILRAAGMKEQADNVEADAQQYGYLAVANSSIFKEYLEAASDKVGLETGDALGVDLHRARNQGRDAAVRANTQVATDIQSGGAIGRAAQTRSELEAQDSMDIPLLQGLADADRTTARVQTLGERGIGDSDNPLLVEEQQDTNQTIKRLVDTYVTEDEQKTDAGRVAAPAIRDYLTDLATQLEADESMNDKAIQNTLNRALQKLNTLDYMQFAEDTLPTGAAAADRRSRAGAEQVKAFREYLETNLTPVAQPGTQEETAPPAANRGGTLFGEGVLPRTADQELDEVITPRQERPAPSGPQLTGGTEVQRATLNTALEQYVNEPSARNKARAMVLIQQMRPENMGNLTPEQYLDVLLARASGNE